eukprot:COSAG01_NODE_1324_length_10724_cov_27.870776_9_plen_176_part_00
MIADQLAVPGQLHAQPQATATSHSGSTKHPPPPPSLVLSPRSRKGRAARATARARPRPGESRQMAEARTRRERMRPWEHPDPSYFEEWRVTKRDAFRYAHIILVVLLLLLLTTTTIAITCLRCTRTSRPLPLGGPRAAAAVPVARTLRAQAQLAPWRARCLMVRSRRQGGAAAGA